MYDMISCILRMEAQTVTYSDFETHCLEYVLPIVVAALTFVLIVYLTYPIAAVVYGEADR